MGSILQGDHQLGEFIMVAQSHGVQSQLSSSVREGKGGSMEVQPAEGMIEGDDDDVALQNINGETLQTVEGNKESEAQENYCVEVADTLQPIQGIQHSSDSLLPPINAPNNEEVVLESEISIPNSVSVFDLFDLQIRELQEKEVQGLASNDNSTFNSNNSDPDFTHRNHYVINQGFMSDMVTKEQSNTQLNETEAELDKSDHHDFISFNPHDFDSCASSCTSVQTQKEEACASHYVARVPTLDTPLRVLPKWSRRVREVHPSARPISESLSGQKRDASDMDICSDLPSKRQQVYQSDVEEIFELVEADHQPRQDQ